MPKENRSRHCGSGKHQLLEVRSKPESQTQGALEAENREGDCIADSHSERWSELKE
jgi:hypothetical protein